MSNLDTYKKVLNEIKSGNFQSFNGATAIIGNSASGKTYFFRRLCAFLSQNYIYTNEPDAELKADKTANITTWDQAAEKIINGEEKFIMIDSMSNMANLPLEGITKLYGDVKPGSQSEGINPLMANSMVALSQLAKGYGKIFVFTFSLAGYKETNLLFDIFLGYVNQVVLLEKRRAKISFRCCDSVSRDDFVITDATELFTMTELAMPGIITSQGINEPVEVRNTSVTWSNPVNI